MAGGSAGAPGPSHGLLLGAKRPGVVERPMPDTNPARAAMEPPRKQMVHGVLLVDGAYVLQLRDDVPGIASPGMWAFFGGALEEGEEPELGLRREIAEELSIEIDRCELLCHVDRRSDFWRQVVRYWFFVSDVTIQWPAHEVREGQGAGLFRFSDLPATGVPDLVREIVTRHHRGLASMSHP